MSAVFVLFIAFVVILIPVLIFALREARSLFLYPKWLQLGATVAIVALGLAHLGSLLFLSKGRVMLWVTLSGVGFLLVSVLPYVVCLLLARVANNIGAALGGLLAVAMLDAFMYWTVVTSRGSTASLVLLVALPLKLFGALPLGALVGVVINTAITKRFIT